MKTFIVLPALIILCSCDQIVNSQLHDVQNRVAQDAIEQYNIAVRQGDNNQIFVQAGMVSAAFLQAKDEINYRKWKQIEDSIGHKIGM
jgi:hypothetical protein